MLWGNVEKGIWSLLWQRLCESQLRGNRRWNAGCEAKVHSKAVDRGDVQERCIIHTVSSPKIVWEAFKYIGLPKVKPDGTLLFLG